MLKIRLSFDFCPLASILTFEKVLDLVTGNGGHFGLGYTIVCNRSQSNLDKTIAERNELERLLFQSEPWRTIPSHKAGISALKTQLDTHLVDLAQQNFEEVGRDTTLAIEDCYKRLRSLGPERSDTTGQRNYLLKVSTEFQSLTSHALDAYYARDKCFVTHEELRLATIIKGLQEEFSTTMRRRGHTREFLCWRDLNKPVNQESSSSNSDADKMESKAINPPSLAVVHLEKQKALRSILEVAIPPGNKPCEDIITWIRREYDFSKGFEIGIINPSLLRILYHEQIKHWRYYAIEHINKVIMTTHTFVMSLLNHLCPDLMIRERFWARLGKEVLVSYKKAVEHVELLLKIEEQGNMRSLNHYFAVTLKKLRQDRLKNRVANSKTWTTSNDKQEILLRLNDVMDAHISNDDQTVEDLHDILYSYYKLSRKQFVDAVAKCPVDYFLLTVDNGPLKACSPEFVGRLSDDELKNIAGESNESIKRRAEILRELHTLNDAQEVLRK